MQEEREARLASLRQDGCEVGEVFNDALARLPTEDHASLIEVFEFAKSLDYQHPGLAPTAYLAHPVRVMSLVVRLHRPYSFRATALALVHNALEVTSLTEREVSEQLGAEFASALSALTVNRADTSRESVARYYAVLNEAPEWVRVVKVLDKLDNLFVLGLNPDAGVRSQYLADVEEYVRPLAESSIPALVPYLDDLISDCRVQGEFELGLLDAR